MPTLLINNFNGGVASGSKRGIAGAFRFARGHDIHSDPDVLKVNPASTKDSGTTVVDLPMFGVNNTVNDNKYFLGDAGKLYKRTSAGTWSVLNTYTNAEGMGFFSGTDLIYFNSDDQQYTLDPDNDSITSYRALNTAEYHPVETFIDKVFTGNGRELISTDGSAIDYDKDTVGGGLTIGFNYKIRCLKNLGNWLFIGATSENSSDARYYLWDGYSEDWNYARSLKGEDGINAVEISDDGTILVFAGKKGNIYQLVGIDSPLKDIKTIPRIEKDKTAEIYPGSTASYQKQTIFGLSTGTTITGEKGVWSWSSTDKNYAKVLNLDYSISTATETGVNVKIGALLVPNSTDLFIGWKDGSTYGVDLIDGTGVQASTTYESLIHDDGVSDRTKHYKKFVVKLTDNLQTGEVVTLSYKANRGTAVDIGTLDFSADGAINKKTFKPDIKTEELEVLVATANAGTTAPSIDSIAVEFTTNPT